MEKYAFLEVVLRTVDGDIAFEEPVGCTGGSTKAAGKKPKPAYKKQINPGSGPGATSKEPVVLDDDGPSKDAAGSYFAKKESLLDKDAAKQDMLATAEAQKIKIGILRETMKDMGDDPELYALARKRLFDMISTL
eukprot:jgi/Mesvir1/26072/Mv06797-RA.1